MKRLFLAAAVICLMSVANGQVTRKNLPSARTKRAEMNCRQVTFEGEVKAGQGFKKTFAGGLEFYLEPLASGWIVRVFPADAPRGPHDYAELATPPYKSVSPLLLSTDWAFRSQDAIAWNPRRFRYAGSRTAFQRLATLYRDVIANHPDAISAAASLVARQPEGQLQILDAKIAPGVSDQAKMASMVAQSLSQTPHEVDQSVSPTPLGRIELLRFRVILEIAPGTSIASGLNANKIPCSIPTT